VRFDAGGRWRLVEFRVVLCVKVAVPVFWFSVDYENIWDSSSYYGYLEMVLESNSTDGCRYDLGTFKSKLFNLIFKGDFVGSF
jgi:hypothetical protein